MEYIIGGFFILIGLLVLTVQNKHFKAAYSFVFLAGVGLLIWNETDRVVGIINIFDRTIVLPQILQAFAVGITLPFIFQVIIWFIFKKVPKEKIGLDYDLITGVLSFLHFGLAVFLGHLFASWIGVFATSIGYWLIYTFGRVLIKHTKLIGTERNNSLAIIALLPIIAFQTGYDSINIFDGNVLLGFFAGAIFVLMNLVAGLLTEKLTTRYFVLFLSIGLFIAGGFGMKIKENFGGIETLIAGIYSILIVIAFARSFGNPLKLINFNFNSLLFLFTGVLLIIAPFISKPDLNAGKELTKGQISEVNNTIVKTKSGDIVEIIKINEEALGNWNFREESSNITFEITSQGKATKGRFDHFSGFIDIKDSLNLSEINLDVDVKSINTFSSGRDEHLRAEDYFDTDKFPKAMFKSNRIELVDSLYTAHGSLTMKGKKQNVDIQFKLKHKGSTDDKLDFAVFVGQFKIDRTKFNMARENGLDDEVRLAFELEGRLSK